MTGKGSREGGEGEKTGQRGEKGEGGRKSRPTSRQTENRLSNKCNSLIL